MYEQFVQLIYIRTYLSRPHQEWIYLDQSFSLLFDYLSNPFYPLSNSLGPSSLTHSLQIYCTGLIGPTSLYILGLDSKNMPLQLYRFFFWWHIEFLLGFHCWWESNFFLCILWEEFLRNSQFIDHWIFYIYISYCSHLFDICGSVDLF